MAGASKSLLLKLVLGVFVAAAFAACGSAGPSVSPSVSPSPAAVSPSPSPSPSPDVATAFIVRMKDTSLAAALTLGGDMTVSDQTFPIDGDGALSGSDSRFLMRITLPAGEQVTEQVKLDGRTWKRSARGPWLEEEAAAGGESQDLTTLLASILSVKDQGIVTRDGRELHRLVPSDEIAVSREAFGITDPAIEDFKGGIEFLAEPDGTPAVWTMTMSWNQMSGTALVEAAMTLDFVFQDVGKPVSIEKPDDVWTRYESKTLGYRIAHPAEWEVTTEGDVDYFQHPDGGPLLWVSSADLPAGTKLEDWAKAVADDDESTLGVAPVSSTRSTVAGGPAQVLFFQGGELDGEPVVAFDVLVPRGKVGYGITWVSAPGNEQADAATLDAFLATFEVIE